jgi:hypothetical protein
LGCLSGSLALVSGANNRLEIVGGRVLRFLPLP